MEIEAQRVKYVHILYRNEIKFNKRIIEMINDVNLGFKPEEHLFISCYLDQYELLKDFENVVLDTDTRNLINKYGKKYDLIIAHSIKSIKDILFAKKNYLNKTVFRYWGGGIYGFHITDERNIKNVIKRLINRIYLYKLKKLKGIGIANVVDMIEIEKKIKNIKLFQLSYVTKDNYEALIKYKKSNKKESTLNIMIGHRGCKEGNHLKILNILQKFKDENIEIFIPISYGDSIYIDELKAYVKKITNLKINLIEKFMDYEEYCKFLSGMDIGIFSGTQSYALGNISILLYYEKKLFLDKNGLLYETFKHEGVPCGIINEINVMSFEGFSKPIRYENGAANNLMVQDLECSIKNWNCLFNSLLDRNDKK